MINTLWYSVYDKLAQLLVNFYEEHKEEAGKILYNKLFKTEEKLEEKERLFKWLGKLSEVKSIDPFHVFVAINAAGSNEERRIERINIFIELLGGIIYENIDFTGCPSPRIGRMLSARNQVIQENIWEAFVDIKQRANAFSKLSVIEIETSYQEIEKWFNKIDNWYGVGFYSFTIVLFWSNHKYFLPLDRHTIELLLQYNKTLKPPRRYKNYLPLLDLEKVKEASLLYVNLVYVSYDWTNFKTLETRTPNEAKEIQTYLNIEQKIVKANFKIIAIQPLEGCNSNYFKTLEENYIYQFYQFYDFSPNGEKITYHVQKDVQLYQIENGPSINIGAIVGENGTGKSTITELLIAVMNNLSKYYYDREELKQEVFDIENLKVRLYVQMTAIYCIEINNDSKKEVNIYKYSTIENVSDNRVKIEEDKGFLSNLFYTIMTNYSLHSLNDSKFETQWLKPIFHKNDAYQVPIVIDPMRTDGNIQINIQEELVKDRLLVSLLEQEEVNENDTKPTKSFRQITKFQTAVKLSIQLNRGKIERDTIAFTAEEPVSFQYNIKENVSFIINSTAKHFNINEILTDTDFESLETLVDYVKRYIVKKIVKIALTYPHYGVEYFDKKNKTFKKIDNSIPKCIDKYIEDLSKDTSHITIKLRQAINLIKYEKSNILLQKNKESITRFGVKDTLTIEVLSNKINDIIVDEGNKGIILTVEELMPPSFFTIDIILDSKDKDIEVSFFSLSSGEKQKIYSTHSILYHLRNLNSVFDSNKDIFAYNYVNIILEEIELYFHPELQRSYISYLLQELGKLNLSNIFGINILFVTHSPFILSDIPRDNILALKKDELPDGSYSAAFQKKNLPKTFGANIHELLVNGFFMEKSIGQFALEQIRSIVDFHEKVIEADESKNEKEYSNLRNQYENEKDKFNYIKNIVGEKYIIGALENHIEGIEIRLGLLNTRDAEIKRLEAKIAELKKNDTQN